MPNMTQPILLEVLTSRYGVIDLLEAIDDRLERLRDLIADPPEEDHEYEVEAARLEKIRRQVHDKVYRKGEIV
jgi:hypothetical protein